MRTGTHPRNADNDDDDDDFCVLAWPKGRTTSDKVITSAERESYSRLCKFKAKNSALIIIIFAFVKRRGAAAAATTIVNCLGDCERRKTGKCRICFCLECGN